jgi:hypothetical protein
MEELTPISGIIKYKLTKTVFEGQIRVLDAKTLSGNGKLILNMEN